MSEKQQQQQQQNTENDSTNNNIGAQNDEAFTAFLFAIVSCILLFIYAPILFKAIKELFRKITGAKSPAKKKKNPTKKQQMMLDQPVDQNEDNNEDDDEDDESSVLAEGFGDAQYVFNGIKYVAANPGKVSANVAAMRAHPEITWTYIFPRVRRFVIRPRILLLILWVVLFFSVLHNTLTYDPYAILGLDATASSISEVKKVYRKLTKINHPDHNKTDAAKMIFPQIKKAYKTIMNREKGIDETEERPEEFSVGVGLPSWMISGKGRVLTIFLLICSLIAIPMYLFSFLGQNQNSQLESVYNSVLEGNDNIEKIFKRIGIPEDKTLTERRSQRMKFFNALVDVGAIDKNMPPALIDKLPPLRQFRARLISTRKNLLLQQHPFLQSEETITNLIQRFAQEDELEKKKEKEQKEQKDKDSAASSSSSAPTFSKQAFESELFLLQQVLHYLFKQLEIYTNIIGAETTTCRKTLKTHDQIIDSLKEYEKAEGRLGQRQMNELIETTRKLEDLYKELRDAADSIREHRMRKKMEEAQMLQEALHESRNTRFEDE